MPLQWCVVLVLTIVIGVSHSLLHDALNRCQSHLAAPQLLPDYQTVQTISLGFDRLAADYFWLSFVGYVGNAQERKRDRYALADDYLELITGLDNQFVQAYWFAAFIVGGEQNNPRRAAQIIEGGIVHNSESWHLPFIAGVNQLLYAKDEIAGARFFRAAAKHPGSPRWLSRQAEILEAKIPGLLKQANCWYHVLNSAGSPQVREHARERCVWLWVQVYKTAPNDAYHNRAREVLKELGVDVGSLKKPE